MRAVSNTFRTCFALLKSVSRKSVSNETRLETNVLTRLEFLFCLVETQSNSEGKFFERKAKSETRVN